MSHDRQVDVFADAGCLSLVVRAERSECASHSSLAVRRVAKHGQRRCQRIRVVAGNEVSPAAAMDHIDLFAPPVCMGTGMAVRGKGAHHQRGEGGE